MLSFSTDELRFKERLTRIKREAGSHSPGVQTLLQKIPELRVHMDACFLSNPYATDLFIEHFRNELVETGKIRDYLELYPSQNSVLAEALAPTLGVSPHHVFMGNGAAEVIQAVVHNFCKKKLIVNLPTFSCYYEFARGVVPVVHYRLAKENNFELDPDDYIAFVKREQPDGVVLINPNNPDGSYMPKAKVYELLSRLNGLVSTVILDESFIHFAFEEDSHERVSFYDFCETFPNLIILKSMSKDYGIAGLRVGYAVMSASRVQHLLRNGYLWNSNGLAEYFLQLNCRPDFQQKYETARRRYLEDRESFGRHLAELPESRVYPSMANFYLLELTGEISTQDFVAASLYRHGIYLRDCEDKIGLDGQFVRIAVRKQAENVRMLTAFADILS